jgi:periplasmic protein TonB
MNRRWWGGSGLSIAFHAALLVGLFYAAARPSQLDATTAIASRRTKFMVAVAPGSPRTGGGGDGSTVPRTARIPEARPLDIVAPQIMTRVESLPVGAVPMILTDDVDRLPGASLPVDGTVGNGSGPRGGGGPGPGNGPGDGPGAGDVYDAGVGGVSAPRLIHEVKPNFTVEAMRAKLQGVVLMDVIVLADGSVDAARIQITRSLDPGLDREATIAVRQWRFRPSLRFGHPVASRVTVELAFTLR